MRRVMNSRRRGILDLPIKATAVFVSLPPTDSATYQSISGRLWSCAPSAWAKSSCSTSKRWFTGAHCSAAARVEADERRRILARERANNRQGRDHHPFGFSAWLVGGGIKGGIAHGAIDELSFNTVENRHHVTHIHTTIWHQIDFETFHLDVPGRKRLEKDCGASIREIIA